MSTSQTPIWVAEVELADSLEPHGILRSARKDDRTARIFVRLHGRLLGFVELPLGRTDLNSLDVDAAVRSTLAEPLRRHVQADGLSLPDTLPFGGLGSWGECASVPRSRRDPVDVVICTTGDLTTLGRCLDSLRRLRYENFEVVVVDNAPSLARRDGVERVAGGDARFRYVVEPIPGLSRARNRGLRETRASIVAFTDDDALVDEWWLHGIVAGFAKSPAVGCVTGIVLPAELDGPAQLYFDRRYAWAERMQRSVYASSGKTRPSPLYPYSAGIFGTGANFAVNADLFKHLGGFDERLGAGTRARGGEDLDAFVRVIRAGRAIVYDPSAIVWHAHRRDPRSLRRQLFSYGVGLTAFLTKYVVDPRTRGEILLRAPAGVSRIGQIRRARDGSGSLPLRLALFEALGLAVGPLAYIVGAFGPDGVPPPYTVHEMTATGSKSCC